MKVIFTENIKGVANRGDLKSVKRGYYRNYLLPFSKAVVATDSVMKEWESRRKTMLIEKEQLRAKFEETRSRLEGTRIKIEKKVTKTGTLYGGVKSADIAKAIKNSLNIEVPVEAISIKKTIKAVGEYEVGLNFGEGIVTTVKVEVVEKAS